MDEPIKDLWLGLKENVSGFSVDFNTFKSDMADEAKRSRLHNSLVQKGLYTKTLEDFNSQFMGSVPVKKKETTSQPSSPVAEQPITPSSTIHNSFGIETVNTTQETQNSIGGQPLPNNSRISPNQSQFGWSDNPTQQLVTPQYATNAPIDQASDTYRKEIKQKNLAAQSTSKEFSNTMLNSNSPLIKEKSLFAQSLIRDVKPEEQALIQQNFSNLSPDYQQDVANYLAKVQVENPSKHAELVSRVGENGLDQKTKAQILGQATNDRLQTAARDFAILEARNKEGKEINPNDAEETVTRYNKSISDMSNVLQQFPEELDRVRKIKAQNDEMTIKDSDSFLTQIAKQTGAALGGVQNALLDGAKSTLEWARDVSDQLSGEQDTRGLTDKFVEGMGNFLDSWHAATPTKYKDEKDLTGEATGGAQGFISQLGSQFGTMALLYKMGAGSSPRLVTAGAATTYSQYYDEADKTGSLSKDGVQKYALFQSTIQGLLELVSPNFGAAEFEKVGLKNGINFLKNNPNASIGDFAKNYLKHNTAEVSQESTQNIGDIVGKLAANEIVGKNTFDPSTTMDEQMQTVTMTTATTLLVSFFTKGHFKAYHKQSLDFLRNVPEAKLVEELNQQVKDGQLTYSQGEKIRQLVKDKTVTPTVEGEKPTMDTPSVEAPKILEQVDEKGNLIPIDKIKETPTPSVKPTEQVQEINEEDLTKETLLNEDKSATDIEDKKADIERRRNNELKEEGYRIPTAREERTWVDEDGTEFKTVVTIFGDGHKTAVNIELETGASTSVSTYPKELPISKIYEVESPNAIKRGEINQQVIKGNIVQTKINNKYDDELNKLNNESKPTDEGKLKPTFENVPIYTYTKEEAERAKKEIFDNLSALPVGSVIENSDGEIKVVTNNLISKKGTHEVGVMVFERQPDGSLVQRSNIVWATKYTDGKFKMDYNPHATATNSKGERVTMTDQITDKTIDLSKEKIFIEDIDGNLTESNAFKKQSESKPAEAVTAPKEETPITNTAKPEPSLEEQAKDLKDGNIVTFEYNNENEVPVVFKDKISSKGETNGKPFVKVTMAKSLADFHLQSIEEAKTEPTDTPRVAESKPSGQNVPATSEVIEMPLIDLASEVSGVNKAPPVKATETPEQRTERVNKTVKESGLTAKEQRAVLGIINETPDGKLTTLLSPTEKDNVNKVVSDIYKQDKLNTPEKTAEQKAQDAAEAPVKKEKPKTALQKGQKAGTNNKVYDEFEPTNLKEELEQYLAKGGQINEADFNAYFGDGKGGIQEEAKKWKDSVSPDAPSLDQATEGMKFKGHGTDTKNAFQEILQENEGSKTVGDKIKAKHAERKAVLEGKNNPFESEDYEKAMEALEEQKAATSSTKELSEQDAKDYHDHSTKVDALEEQAKSDPSVKAKHDEAYNRIVNDPQYQKEDGSFDYEKLEDNIKNGFEPDILEIYNSNNTEDENTKTITEAVKSVRDSKASESGGNTEKGERGNTEGGTDGKQEREQLKNKNNDEGKPNLAEQPSNSSREQTGQDALKDNTPTEIDENNIMDALNDKQAFIDQKTSELDAAIEQAEKDLKKAMKGIVASSGLPFNKGGVFESAVKLGYLKFKRFFYSNGRMMSMSEMATALGTKVSDGFKNVYNSVVNIWNKENSSSFHEELSNADQAARLIQDKNVAIKNLYNDLKNAGVEITDEVNFAEMQELSTSKIADAQRRTAEWFRGMEGDAQITGIAKSQKESWVGRVKEQIGSYKEQLDYMFAKHALGYNARAREIVAKRNEAEIKDKQIKVDTLTEEYLAETDPSVQKKLQDKITKLNNEITAIQNEPMPDMPSGMTDADADAILGEAAKDPDKMAKMDAFAKEFRDEVVLKRLDLLEQSGIISAETAQQMRDGKREGFVSEMPNYLPLKVKSENFTEIAKPTTLRALGSKIFGIKVSNEFEREKRYDPLQMAVTELQAAQSAAVQNEGLNALYEAVKQSPFGKQIKIINTRGTYAANEDGQLTDTKTEPKVEVKALLQDHAIPFKVGGKIKYLFFTPIKTAEGKLKPHPVIQALKTQPKDTPNIIKSLMNGMRVMTNYLRLIRTTYNIGFAADNPFRDLGEALTNISDVADSKTVEKIRLQIIKNTPTSFAYFFNPSKKGIGLDGQTRTKEFDQYFDEMRREGVTMSWGNYEGIDEKIDNFQGDIDRIEQGKYGKTGTQIAMTSFKVLGALSEATENTTRLSVYAAMRQNGFSPQKAAYVAKNITLNFEKGGTATPVVNMLWMFSNAGIQGTARMMKAAKTANFWRFGAAMTLYAGLNHAALLLNMDDDDEDKWIYNNIEAKGRTLIYNPLDPKNPIRLPKPYSAMRIFLNMGEGITDVYFGKRTISDVATNNVGDALMSAIDPLGGSGNSRTNYIPTEPLKNYYQVQFNENWAGQPIYRGEEKANKKDLPDYLRTNPNTPSKYDRMALGLHDNIGLDMQPTTLEFIYDNYAKNAVNSVTDYGKLATSAYDWATGKEVKAEDVPALKRFYSNIEDKAKGKAVLYNVLDLLDKPDNITKEQIRFAESQLVRFKTDGTPSYFISKIQTGINEAKNPSLRKAKDDAELNKFKEGIDKKAATGK